ncbi:hypothetical protein CC85DRAFT_87687 [Cutaneotrichosporon oleaginosum]|uniref:Uncharacterized protein n=1 Tax=Cutaneotrichosporon oleaginosum TaxID=879819 RepID=A0A0J0XXT1_9TREE|nr:uncharacterized protein CC85DRAFT_87687 [Cutaneotrichosporon oleaginosum]KLT45877.1 hypothetical protein CC85DRAFT_87687 [Cutaneotrichosporon oleaginosum]TXT06578.1 hypothetical protein COLE_05909 [Cutaneotrichosporon oleaginosum]
MVETALGGREGDIGRIRASAAPPLVLLLIGDRLSDKAMRPNGAYLPCSLLIPRRVPRCLSRRTMSRGGCEERRVSGAPPLVYVRKVMQGLMCVGVEWELGAGGGRTRRRRRCPAWCGGTGRDHVRAPGDFRMGGVRNRMRWVARGTRTSSIMGTQGGERLVRVVVYAGFVSSVAMHTSRIEEVFGEQRRSWAAGQHWQLARRGARRN